MTELDVNDTRALVESLCSDVCPACEKRKRHAQSLCGNCYRRLTADERSALYDRVGAGYEEAMAAALKRLRPGESGKAPATGGGR